MNKTMKEEREHTRRLFGGRLSLADSRAGRSIYGIFKD
jgi:hypothetical protein